MHQNFAHLLGSFSGYISASTCRGNQFGPIVVGCGRAKKVPLGCMQMCANMNSEELQPTKCENYELSKRSVSHLLQLFSPQKIFFVNFGSQIDKFNHFLTVFCHEIG
jgi:hypothetical protein